MWPFADSKLVDVTTVGEVDAEEHDHNSLVKILKLKSSQNIEAEVWSTFKKNSDFEQKVGQDFEVEAKPILWSWSFVNILILMFSWTLKLKLDRDFEGMCENLWYDLKAATLVRALNPWVSYAFGLWQCF